MENGLEEYPKSTHQRLCTIMVLLFVPPKYQSTEAIDVNNKTPTQTTPEINARTYPKNRKHQILPPSKAKEGRCWVCSAIFLMAANE